jgi:hypothetical protein
MSEEPQHVGTLQIDQDLVFQNRTWKVQRIAWAVLGLAILAGLLGVFGTGVASHATAGGAGALLLEYERFECWGAPAKLRLHLEPSAEAGGAARVWLGTEYIEDLRIEAITPEPESVEADRDRLIYTFRVAQGQPALVTFYFSPERAGLLTGQAGVVGGQALRFRQFIYP